MAGVEKSLRRSGAARALIMGLHLDKLLFDVIEPISLLLLRYPQLKRVRLLIRQIKKHALITQLPASHQILQDLEVARIVAALVIQICRG